MAGGRGTTDEELRAVLDAAARMMRASLDGGHRPNRVYRLVGRPCRAAAGRSASRGQGDANRIAYGVPAASREGGTG